MFSYILTPTDTYLKKQKKKCTTQTFFVYFKLLIDLELHLQNMEIRREKSSVI